MNEESDTSNKGLFVLGILVVLVLGVLAFILFGFEEATPSSNQVEYNYYTFDEVGGLWQTTLVNNDQSYLAVFRFNPTQVEDVYVTGNFSGFKSSPLYLTFDPDASSDDFKYLALGTTELSIHLIRSMGFHVEAACTKNETDACVDRPIVTCDSNQSVIYLVPKTPTQVTLKGSCVTVSGDKFELLKSIDRLLFQWYKIVR